VELDLADEYPGESVRLLVCLHFLPHLQNTHSGMKGRIGWLRIILPHLQYTQGNESQNRLAEEWWQWDRKWGPVSLGIVKGPLHFWL
jgi:hypothetical protein